MNYEGEFLVVNALGWPCRMDNDGILYTATALKGATIFRYHRSADNAVDRTRRFAKRMNFNTEGSAWAGFRIIRVHWSDR